MGGDPYAPPVSESTASALQAYTKYLPDLMKSTAAQILPTEQAQATASQAISPQYAALQNELYKAYGPQAAQVASDIEKQNMMNQAQSEAGVLSGPGQDVIKAGLEASKIADPEYYANRTAAGGALNELLQPNLSGGEREEVQRSLNRSNATRGTLDTPSSINTVENAMTFGNTLRDRLGSALNTASSVLPALKSGVDPFLQATGRQGTVVTGQPQTSTPTQTGASTFGTANQFMTGVMGLQSQANEINANRRDSLDRFSQVMGSMPSISG